jgi:hypothetical protein
MWIVDAGGAFILKGIVQRQNNGGVVSALDKRDRLEQGRLMFPRVLAVFVIGMATAMDAAIKPIPDEPVRIGHEAQFLFDGYIVDNHWAIRYKRQAMKRVVHQAVKHAGNPVMQGDQASYLTVTHDSRSNLFRMYYQANFLVEADGAADTNQETLPDFEAIAKRKGRKFKTHIAYAESQDGIVWTRPHLNQFPWHQKKPNNIVIARRNDAKIETCAPALLELPTTDRGGFRYQILYRAKGRGGKESRGIRIASSKDGIHWNESDDQLLTHLHSDHPNTLVHDADRAEYILYCRAKNIYRAWGEDMLDTGASRRIARFASDSLTSGWQESAPQTVLIPDERDSEKHYNFFYGMPVRIHAGVYFGFLEPFRMNDFIHTELAVSRDGLQWQRFPGRDKLIAYGPEGSWDDEMIFASPAWVERGDEWWIYYSGWDGPHGTPERTGRIGLAKIRKEGFVSWRGPKGGGVIATRRMIWPGGGLALNAAVGEGMIKVRISDANRKPLPSFDYDDCDLIPGDGIRLPVTWGGRSLDELKGQELRLEIYLQESDLYTFAAMQP